MEELPTPDRPSHSRQAPIDSPSSAAERRKRKPISCNHCRHSKLRCDRELPCGACRQRGRGSLCSFPPRTPASTRQARSRRVLNVPSTPNTYRSFSLRQGCTARSGSIQSDAGHFHVGGDWPAVLERPIADHDRPLPSDATSPFSISADISFQAILGVLPPANCLDYLVSFFSHSSLPFFPFSMGPPFKNSTLLSSNSHFRWIDHG
ncbi:hypothetical protein BDV19DRAFT_79131 [Aspergillus venezuelensis]